MIAEQRRLSIWGSAEVIFAELDTSLPKSTGKAGLWLISSFSRSAACPWEEDDGGNWLGTFPEIVKRGGQALRFRVFARLNSQNLDKVDLLELRAEEQTEGVIGKGELLYRTSGRESWEALGGILGRGNHTEIVLAIFLQLQEKLMINEVPRRRLLSWASSE